jgi:hypothetical protein
VYSLLDRNLGTERLGKWKEYRVDLLVLWTYRSA